MGTIRQGQPRGPCSYIPVFSSSAHHTGSDGLGGLRTSGVPPGCVGLIALVLVLGLCRNFPSQPPPAPSGSWGLLRK